MCYFKATLVLTKMQLSKNDLFVCTLIFYFNIINTFYHLRMSTLNTKKISQITFLTEKNCQ